MKMKQAAFCLAAGLTVSVGFAQDAPATKVAEANTTAAVAQSTSGTSALVGEDSASTSMSSLMAKNFSEEKLQARWKSEEQLYRDADIPEDKIKKLYDLNLTTWRAMASGEKTDYQAYIRDRNSILTPEEMKNLRTTQREAIEKRTSQRDGATTTASQM